MRRVAASLAAALAAIGLSACGEDGAEPGASREATLVLDFQPNAVHAGIYLAQQEGYFEDRGADLEIREPSASTDAPKLLEAGRAEFAIMDIHDVGLARERGFDVEILTPIVQRPLAAVIAVGDVRRPRDLADGTVGVTGLPSDEGVLDAVLEADGVDPRAVRRVTIGFDSVAALSAGRVEAATAFWNAEGVALARRGVDTREFRVDDFHAPRYPELVVVTTPSVARTPIARDLRAALTAGYRQATSDRDRALDALVATNPALDRREQQAQLDALLRADAFSPPGRLEARVLAAWSRWDVEHGILGEPISPRRLLAP